MRLLFYTRHARRGASSRQRSIQFFDALTAHGHQVRHRPFFSDAYLTDRGAGRASRVLMSFLRRFASLVIDAGWADVVVVEKELLPHLPASVERLIGPRGRPVVYDFDDAVWRSHERASPSLFHRWMTRKTRALVVRATHVTAGSRHLRDQLAQWTEAPVTLVPTTVPAARYRGQGLRAARTIDMVWIGSPSTARHLAGLFPVLETLHRRHGWRLRAIGLPTGEPWPPFVTVEPWSEATEIDLLASARVGVMPLPDDPFERGKCGFKLVQYMGVGLPVVASAVGENRHLVVEGRTGLLARTDAEWTNALTRLLSAPDLAERMGEAGHARFLDLYTAEAAARRLESVWRQAAEGGGKLPARPR